MGRQIKKKSTRSSIFPSFQSLWNNKYLRWIVDLSPQEEAAERAKEIVQENKLAKAKVLRLRKQLLTLLEEAEKLGLVVEEEEEEGEEVDATEATEDELVMESEMKAGETLSRREEED